MTRTQRLLQIKHPENFFLLRGNHECASINRIYGFYDECKRRYTVRLWKTFTDCFNCLPVAALIDEKVCALPPLPVILQVVSPPPNRSCACTAACPPTSSSSTRSSAYRGQPTCQTRACCAICCGLTLTRTCRAGGKTTGACRTHLVQTASQSFFRRMISISSAVHIRYHVGMCETSIDTTNIY